MARGTIVTVATEIMNPINIIKEKMIVMRNMNLNSMAKTTIKAKAARPVVIRSSKTMLLKFKRRRRRQFLPKLKLKIKKPFKPKRIHPIGSVHSKDYDEQPSQRGKHKVSKLKTTIRRD